MSTKYTKKFIERRFARFSDEMGLSRECWRRVDGTNVANIGAIYLDYEPCYGGYAINQMMSDGGGVNVITGTFNRMSGRELDSWMEGALWAKRNAKA